MIIKETYSVMSDSGSLNGIKVNEREVRDSVHTTSNDLYSVNENDHNFK